MAYPVIRVFVHTVDIQLVIRLFVAIFLRHLQPDRDILSQDHPMVVYIVS